MNSGTEDLPGRFAPVLRPELLARLHTLNLDYLELLVAERAHSNVSGMQYLPERVRDALRKTSPEMRQALAKTSYALYSLGFEDHDFWLTALRVDPERIHREGIDARYGSLSASVMQGSFCELALLHAWHVAVTHPIAARLLYGMDGSIVACFARAQLWQLRRIAMDYPGLLMPRWPSNPCFWPDLIRLASLGDSKRLRTAQQLGHQLIAMELQIGDSANSPAKQRQRNLLQQRLQQKKQ